MQRDMLNEPEQTNEFGDYSVETEYGNIIRASEDGKIELRSKNADEGATVVIYDNLGQIKVAKPYRNADFAFEKFNELTGSNETLDQFYGGSRRDDDEEDLDGDLYESKEKITEADRVVMKVPSTQAPVQPQVPQQNVQGVEPEMPTEQPTQDENPFGKEKFDAGVEADESTDPKHFIEQLTGKLAQSLRTYNETAQDIDLNKFVVNSLIPASVPKMSSEDAQDVIKKVQDNIGQEQAPEANAEAPAEPTAPEQGIAPEQEQPAQNAPKLESKKSNKKLVKEESIDELVERLLRGEDDENALVKKKDRKSPFSAPKFK